MEIVARRTMNYAYPIIDAAFIVAFCILLFFSKRKRALVWGLLGGALYFVVDYGIFHLLTGSRSIENANMFLILLWMSFSYGITNFVWIWLWFEKDEHFWGFSALIFFWWIACPMISEMFVSAPVFSIQRTTGAYHGVMGIILFFSYAGVVVYNLLTEKSKRVNILWLIAIGVLVQFGWESSLLISGIRSGGMSALESIRVMIVNSLLETNLGIPLMYLIFIKASKAFDRRSILIGNLSPAVCFHQGKER